MTIDDLKTPSEEAAVISGAALLATTGGCAMAAFLGNPGPALYASPFFLGAFVGLFAVRWPLRAVLILAISALAALALIADTRETAATVLCGAEVLAYAAPLAGAGAVAMATVGRRLRASQRAYLAGRVLDD
jgi:hypothetical protein